MANKNENNISKFPKVTNVNIGMIIFFILILYIIIVIISAVSKQSVSATQVQSGKIVDSSIFTGIAIRDETVVTTPVDGYLNYYINDGDRAKKDSRVCLVDTTGTYTSAAVENNNIQFSSKDYDDIEGIISLYSNAYSNSNYSDIYTFKYNLQNKITEIISSQAISSAEAVDVNNDPSLVPVNTGESGIVSYSYDGMEGLTADAVTVDMFNYANYTKTQLTSSERIAAGSPAFKLTRDSQWSVVIKLNANQVAVLANEPVIQIKFTKDDISTWAYVRVFTNEEGSFAELSMSRYMVRYITDRYLEIEVVTAEVSGLKIPTTAVDTKDFYTIPQDYLITDPSTNEAGFYKYSYDSNGELKMELIKPIIYRTIEGMCYVDLTEFSLGDYIGDGISKDGQYRIGATGTLYGVYNINQGYTVFRIIDILYQNDDYCIAKANTTYGVSQYDRIVLNADSVDEEEIIY